MASLRAKEAAKEIVANLRTGNHVPIAKVMLKHGYSHVSTRHPKNLTETQSYKDIVDPYVAKMTRKRDIVLAGITEDKIKAAPIASIATTFDVLNKNILLAQGKATENVASVIEFVRYNDDDEVLDTKE